MEKDDKVLSNEIYKIARSENMSVLGIGPASEMDNEPLGHRPEDYLQNVKTLICFGIPVPWEVYHTPTYNLETSWRSQNLLYRRLDTLALRFSNMIEEYGAYALPIYGCMPLGVNESGTVVGYVNQIKMVEVTGIGVIGKNGLLIHSQYGSRLMLGGVLTTASLSALCYPKKEESGCPPDCQICSNACPVNAILPERKQVNIMRCLSYTARTPAMSRLKFLFLRGVNKKSAARYMSMTSFDEHTFHICSKCVALCPYGNKKLIQY